MNGPMRILVVERGRDYTKALRRTRSGPSFVVDTAHDGFTAQVLAFGGEYDASVLDLTLPGCDGPTLCHRLRGDGVDSPVLLIADPGAVGLLVMALQAGGTDFVFNPYATEELSTRVHAAARRYVQSRV